MQSEETLVMKSWMSCLIEELGSGHLESPSRALDYVVAT